MVEMAVDAVGRTEDGNLVAVLRERAGDRSLGIGIGEHSAMMIQAHIAQVGFPRPHTYTLLLRVVDGLGGRVVRTTLDRTGGHPAEAYLELEGPIGVLELRCSPEDAVVVASQAEVSVLVSEGILSEDDDAEAQNMEEAGADPEDPEEDPDSGQPA